MSRDGRETATRISEVRTGAQVRLVLCATRRLTIQPDGFFLWNERLSYPTQSSKLHHYGAPSAAERRRTQWQRRCLCMPTCGASICATEDLDPFYPTPLCACSSRISAGSRIFVWYWPLPLPEAAPMGKYTTASWSVVACRAQTYQSVYSTGGLDGCGLTFVSFTGTVLTSTHKLEYISWRGHTPCRVLGKVVRDVMFRVWNAIGLKSRSTSQEASSRTG